MVESNGKTVLIIDDESATTELLSLLLGSHGFSTHIALSGQEVLESVSSDVDLILIDRMFPNQEGLKVCQQLKSNSKTSEIPIIVISSSHNKTERVESLYLGADDYLTKPFDPEELFARIDVILRRHNQASLQENRDYEIVCELRRIIHEEAVNVYYQPIYNLKTMRLLGFEMFSHPRTTGAMVKPEVFFKLALKYGVYFEAEMIGWNKAVETVSNVFDGRQKLFLNCDPYLFEDQQLKNIEDMFSNYRVSPSGVFLEITEHSATTAYDIFLKRLNEYRFNGFNIALDDLGSGYSSLEAVVEIKPEAIKLDRHLINGVARDPYKKSVVKLVFLFCQENNIICIAEGIEEKEDLDCLTLLGVDAGQGYYLCRPMTSLDLPAMQTLNR